MIHPYANRITDKGIEPFEVVEVVSGRELTIREMIADRTKGWVPKMLMGHCTNESEQRWDIASDDKALRFRIRRSKNGEWKDVSGNLYRLEPRPVRFHRFSVLGGIYDGDEPYADGSEAV
jgi:hypothetical protein